MWSKVATPCSLVATVERTLPVEAFFNSILTPLGPSINYPSALPFTLIARLRENPLSLKERSSQLEAFSTRYSAGSNTEPLGPFILRAKVAKL